MALAFGKMAVQDRDRVLRFGEAAFETLNRLRRQRNFRNENNGGASALERGADGLQINFRFAATRSRREAESGARFPASRAPGLISFSASACSVIQDEIRRCDELLIAMRIARDRFFAQFGQAAFYQRAQRLIIERRLPQQICRRHRRFQFQDRLQQFGLSRRALSQLFDFARSSILRAGWTNNCFFQPTSALRITCGSRLRMTRFNRAAVIGARSIRRARAAAALKIGASPTTASIGRIPFASLCSRVATTVARPDLSRNGTRTREPTVDALGQGIGHGIIELAMNGAVDNYPDVSAGFISSLNLIDRCWTISCDSCGYTIAWMSMLAPQHDPVFLQVDLCGLLALAAGFCLSGGAIGRSRLHALRMDQPGAVSAIRSHDRVGRGRTSARSDAGESGGLAGKPI